MRQVILKLYKDLLRYGEKLKFTDKEYFRYRVRKNFKQNKHLSDQTEINFQFQVNKHKYNAFCINFLLQIFLNKMEQCIKLNLKVIFFSERTKISARSTSSVNS